MSPEKHLAWFEDNIAWIEDRSTDQLGLTVPSCPDWTVESVLNHLSFGLGLAYPVAMSKGPNTSPDAAFDGVEWPTSYPVGADTVPVFARTMRTCLETFRATNPDTDCYTYGGPGKASFWFRRAAIETALHRMDIEEAVLGAYSNLAADRAADGIAEAVEFVLPTAAELVAAPAGKITIESDDLDARLPLGVGNRHATISGSGQDILCALWGRHKDQVSVSGDRDIAAEWLALVEAAFSGR